MKKRVLSIFLGLSILLIYRGEVFAAPESLQVSPAIENITITPGITTSYSLTITNTADRPLGIHADATGFPTPEDGKEDSVMQSPLISWISIDPVDTIFAPQEEKTITITITPPSTIKKGGYYAAIFLTPFISKQQQPNIPLILTRVGTLLLAQYGDTDYTNLKEKAVVKDFSFDKIIAEKTPFAFNFTVKNAYFTHFTAKPYVTITPLFGKSQTIPLSEKHILPGKSKVWNDSLRPHDFSFFYTVHLAVSVGSGNYISADTWFVVIPGFHLILLTAILIFLGFVATFHKRARKALFILLKGDK